MNTNVSDCCEVGIFMGSKNQGYLVRYADHQGPNAMLNIT